VEDLAWWERRLAAIVVERGAERLRLQVTPAARE
jgi:hypothetical protein